MFANWLAHLISLIQEYGAHLFVPNSGGLVWDKIDGQWVIIHANLPLLNTDGKYFVDSLFTITCNALAYLAQASASLAAQPPQ